MVKVLVVLVRKPGMSREEFSRYWRDVHGPIGARMPGLRKYMQDHVSGDGAPFDGVAQMWFDDLAALQGAFTSPAAAEAAADAANFLDQQKMAIVPVEDVAVV